MIGYEAEHVDPVTIVDYVRGRLSRRRAASVREHCYGCADCGDQLAAVILLRQGAGVKAPARYRRPLLAVAATLVVLVGGALAVAVSMRGSESAANSGSVPVTERSGVAATAPGVAPTNLPDALRDPEFRSAAGSVLGFVARYATKNPLPAAATDGQAAGVLEASKASLMRGDFAAAAETLAPFATETDAIGTPLLGISMYLAGRTHEAEPVLADAYRYLLSVPTEQRQESTMSATRLLLAWSLVERGRDEEAVKVLHASIDDLAPTSEGDLFQQQARALLTRIGRSRD